VDPCPTSTCSYSGNEGQSAVVNDWGGGLFADNFGANGTLVVWGGGHNGYGGNEVYLFDVATGLWSRKTEPSAVSFSGTASSCNLSVAEYADGKPCSPHVYDSIQYHPSTHSLVKLGSADNYNWGGNYGGAQVHLFNIQTGTWRRGAALSGSSETDEGPGTAYDSTSPVTSQNMIRMPTRVRARGPITRPLTSMPPLPPQLIRPLMSW
jgi:hypothetical protein